MFKFDLDSDGIAQMNLSKKLYYALLIDFIGVLPTLIAWLITLLTGGAGSIAHALEAIDIYWSFVSKKLIYQLFGSKFWSWVGFTEELFITTDVLPTATIAWLVHCLYLLINWLREQITNFLKFKGRGQG